MDVLLRMGPNARTVAAICSTSPYRQLGKTKVYINSEPSAISTSPNSTTAILAMTLLPWDIMDPEDCLLIVKSSLALRQNVSILAILAWHQDLWISRKQNRVLVTFLIWRPNAKFPVCLLDIQQGLITVSSTQTTPADRWLCFRLEESRCYSHLGWLWFFKIYAE